MNTLGILAVVALSVVGLVFLALVVKELATELRRQLRSPMVHFGVQ